MRMCTYWNKVGLAKSKTKQNKKIDSIGIGLASPEEIRRWGERRLPNGTLIGKVDKDHTVDYESLKPIEGGLFCERIFGPVEDFCCSCERRGKKNEKFCPNCEVEFTKSRVRRTRMGYIPLAVPVAHVWYLRGRPSYIANLIGKSRNAVDRLAYGETLCESFSGNTHSPFLLSTSCFALATLPCLPEGYAQVAVGKSTGMQPSKPLLPKPRAYPYGRSTASYGCPVLTRRIYKASLLAYRSTSTKTNICTTSTTCTTEGGTGGRGGTDVRFSASISNSLAALQVSMFLPTATCAYPSFASPCCTSSILCIAQVGIAPGKGMHGKRRGKQEHWLINNRGGLRSLRSQLRIASNLKDIEYTFYIPKVAILRYFVTKLKSIPIYNIQDSLFKIFFVSSVLRKMTGTLDLFFTSSMFTEKITTIITSTTEGGRGGTRGSGLWTSRSKFSNFADPRMPSCFDYIRKITRSKALMVANGVQPLEKKQNGQYKQNENKTSEKYNKYHTLPLFSTFVYKEWSHRFSFLEYFIWSVQKDDLKLPFFAQHYEITRSRSSAARKNSLNLVKNRFLLHFAKNTPNIDPYAYLGECKAQDGHPSDSLRTQGRSTGMEAVHVKHSTQKVQLKQSSSMLACNLKRNNFVSPSAYKVQLPSGIPFSRVLRQHSSVRLYSPLRFRRKKYSLHTCACIPKVASLVLPCYRATVLPCYRATVQSTGMHRYAQVCTGLATFGMQEAQHGRMPLLTEAVHTRAVLLPTESLRVSLIDTQQFPRLAELLCFTGGTALRHLLSRFHLVLLGKFLRHELKNLELKVNNLLALKTLTYSQGLLLGKLAKRRSKQIRRLKLLELFQSQKSNPEWMILSVLPVLPPDLRPILRVNDDFVVASDLNRLYQTVLRRNNTIHERMDDPLPCPESGLFRQRSLQKAVDGLLENGKGGGAPLCASKRRPLVSLSHVLKGKKGLFRQHLLGKRVDYSGRSVIVVGPRLNLHECGLPKEMAMELFQPFLLHRLKIKGFALSNTAARRMIQQEDPVIWHILKQLVYEHPVLLNRAPTLHRLGIQAFQPRLVSGRAILLHPLVCSGFNADFDGDQMAVHVPLSFQARAEAWKIMWSKNNFLSPATGQPILVPSQDMVLGCYYLSVSVPRVLSFLTANKTKINFSDNQNLVHYTDLLHISKGVNTNESYLAKHRGGNPSTFNPASTTEGGTGGRGGIAYPLAASFFPRAYEVDVNGGARNKQEQEKNSIDSSFLSSSYPLPFRSTLPISCVRREEAHICTGESYRATDSLRTQGISSGMHRYGGEAQTAYHRNGAIFQLRHKTVETLYLHKNKGHYFSNLQDSLVAYFQGRLQTHTPFWVRVNQFSLRIPNENIKTSLLETSISKFCIPNLFVESKVSSLKKYPRSFVENEQDEGLKKRTPKMVKVVRVCCDFFGVPETAKYGINIGGKGVFSTHDNVDKELTLLQPQYGSSQEVCTTLFQDFSHNIIIEGNNTLEAPLELRLSADGNLVKVLTTFQNHYNYNATIIDQCKEKSEKFLKYMRTTAGRVVLNKALFLL